jgi:hypothetical protein
VDVPSSAAWHWRTLTVGTTDEGMATLELCMPSLTAGGLQTWTSRLRNAPDARRIGPFYG